MNIKLLFVFFSVLLFCFTAIAADTPPTKVMILEPKDGATVSTTFKVKFGAEGVEIVPAGTDKPNAGHHHLLIDMETLPALDSSMPTSVNLMHFGKAQTETEITLAPGKHTLQLLLGNHLHIPGSNPIMSEKITITVK
jgi:Domain of unknown function (DUF4399)